jgi:hypothetical protein
MKHLGWLILAFSVPAILGCAGSRLAGTYRAEIRLMEGREESAEPGYSLAEVQARTAQSQRTLTLHSNGRFEWRSGETVNEGKWRVEGNTLILRDDTSNGNAILPVLQDDRRWRLGPKGEIINPGAYSHYNLEEVCTRAE